MHAVGDRLFSKDWVGPHGSQFKMSFLGDTSNTCQNVQVNMGDLIQDFSLSHMISYIFCKMIFPFFVSHAAVLQQTLGSKLKRKIKEHIHQLYYFVSNLIKKVEKKVGIV